MTTSTVHNAIAQRITDALGPTFHADVERDTTYISRDTGTRGRAGVQVHYAPLDYRRRIDPMFVEDLIERAITQFDYGARDPRYTESAKAMSRAAHQAAVTYRQTRAVDPPQLLAIWTSPHGASGTGAPMYETALCTGCVTSAEHGIMERYARDSEDFTGQDAGMYVVTPAGNPDASCTLCGFPSSE